MSASASRIDTLGGRVALVTGGSGGIGAAVCRELAAHGAAVAVAYDRSGEAAQRLAGELRSMAGVDSVALGADLADAAAADELVRQVEQELGPVDVLVANQGIARVRDRLEDIDVSEWDEVLAVNLRASFLLARRAVPGMAERGFGRVLLTSSVAALTGGVVGPHYAASKAGLHGLLHWLAPRVAGRGVTVNALAPALIAETGMLPGDPGELGARIPVGRVGRPAEVADLAVAMLRNPYLTNQVVSLDGGLHPR
jgi:3-oxoacyl-[acyl-carrier protein] reductase